MKKGFTLVEMAIALVILGLIIAIGLPLLGLLTKQNKLTETRTIIKEEKIALVGFAQIHGRLPWADTNGDGQEDTNQHTGYLPYVTLGIRGKDAWLQSIYYDVNDKLANASDLSNFCQILTQLSTNNTADYPQTSSGEMAAVFFSPGENRHPDGKDSDVNSSSNDRVYEDEAKTITENNDDVVGELSLTYLAGLLCTGSGSGSGSGSNNCTTYTIRVTNQAGTKYATVGNRICQRLPSGRTRTYRNQSPNTSIKIFQNQLLCIRNFSPIFSKTAEESDVNGDCTSEIICSILGCTSQ